MPGGRRVCILVLSTLAFSVLLDVMGECSDKVGELPALLGLVADIEIRRLVSIGTVVLAEDGLEMTG